MSDPLQALRSVSGSVVDTGEGNLPPIPAVPQTSNTGLTNWMASVKSWLEKAAGKNGDGLVTKSFLASTGLIESGLDGVFVGSNLPNLSIPPAPTGVTAAGAMTNVLVEWTAAGYANHAYTEVWAAQTDTFSAAVMVGTSAGALFAHSVGTGSTRYYWLRFVSTSDIKGPFNGVSGTIGVTSQDPSWLLSVLNGQLTESQLYAALNTRINLIDGPVGTVGTVAYRVAQEAANRAAALAAESTSRTQAIAVEERARTDAAKQSAEALLRAVLSDNANAIAAEQQTTLAKRELQQSIVDGISAEASERLTLAAKQTTDLASTLAVIASESTARATADSAEATERTLLATQFRGSYTGTDAAMVTEGLVYSERTSRAAADAALSQQITLLSAGVGEQFDWSQIWYFDSSTEGWTGNGTPTVSAGWLRPADQASNAGVYSPVGLASDAAKYGQVRFRVRKTGAPTWAAYVYWCANGESWDNSRRQSIPAPTYDGNGIGLVSESITWTGTVDKIRIDLSSAQTGTDYFALDWVAIGRPSPGASFAQVLAEQTARASGDSANASSITTLSSQVNDGSTGLPATRALLTGSYSTTAAANAATATAQQALITNYGNQRSRVFRQSGAPTQGTTSIMLADGTTTSLATIKTGDIWFDTSDGSKPHTWDGSAWVYTPDASAAASTAYVDSLDTALASSTKATVQSWRNTVAAVTDSNTGLAKTRADLFSITNAQATAISASVSDTRTLRAGGEKDAEAILRNALTADQAKKEATGTLAIAEQALRVDIVTAVSAEASARLVLSAQVDANSAALLSEQTTRATQDSALSTSIDALTATVAGNTAAISNESTARANADSAQVSSISAISARLDSGDVSGAISAAQSTANTAVTNAATAQTAANAVASSVSTLQTTVSGHTTAIQTNANVIDGVTAQYTVKIDNNGVMSGYGLSSNLIAGGTPTSKFIVSADQFAVIAPGRTAGQLNSVPFAVLTSAQTINGVAFAAGVYIDGASINTGTIGNAQIGALAVDSAKIADAAISTAKINDAAITSAKIGNAQIATAHIQTAAITTATIADAQITNAKIGSLAVDTAKIANAAITTAKIGDLAVDTLQIAGNAVTIPVSTYTAGSTTVSGGASASVQSATIVSAGSIIFISTSVRFLAFGIGASGQLDITRDGTPIYTIGVENSYANTSFSASIGDMPGSGSHTYAIKITATSGGFMSMSNRSIFLLETKK